MILDIVSHTIFYCVVIAIPDATRRVEPLRPVAPQDVVTRVRDVFHSMSSRASERGSSPRPDVTLHRLDARKDPRERFRFESSATPSTCGNGSMLRGTKIDLDLVSESVIPMFAAFGLDESRGYSPHRRIDDGEVSAVLEFASLDDGIGIEILDEGWEPLLDEREWETLRQRGLDVFVTANTFADGTDRRTANACVLLGLVEYLNAKTDGPDVPVELFLDRAGVTIELASGDLTVVDPNSGRALDSTSAVFEDSNDSFVVATPSGMRLAIAVGDSRSVRRTIEYRLKDDPRGPSDDPTPREPARHRLDGFPSEFPTDDAVIVVPNTVDGSETRIPITRHSSSRIREIGHGFDPELAFRIEVVIREVVLVPRRFRVLEH